MSFTSVIYWLFPKNHRYFILRGNQEIILSSSLLLDRQVKYWYSPLRTELLWWHDQSSLLISAEMLGFTSSKCSVLVTFWFAIFHLQHLLHWTHFIKCRFVMVYLEVHYTESQGGRVPVDHTGPNERKEVLIFRLNHYTIKIWDLKTRKEITNFKEKHNYDFK